jgi:hypothetical protein
MTYKPWQRWTVLALLLSLSFYALDRAWSQQKALTSEERMKRDIFYLASDECEGRGPGTEGIDKAADYVAQQFKEAGLKPGGVKGTWFQPFEIGGTVKLEGDQILKLQGPDQQTINFKLDENFQVLGNSGSGSVSAPLVFVGYGTTAKDIQFDEYKNVDVAGKIVVLIRRVPRWDDKAKPFDGKNKDQHASLMTKLYLAKKHKAAAVIMVNDRSEKADQLIPLNTFASAMPVSIPAVTVSRASLEPVFKTSLKKTLPEIEKEIDTELAPASSALTGWSATLICKLVRPSSQRVKNVIGVVEGFGPLADETVVVGAHYDHLGYGGFGSLAKLPKGEKRIHFGADDNGSGTTSVMELARRFAAMKDRQGRRIVFMTFSAEERGLLGSHFYCDDTPLFPLEKTVAMVNLDMVGRMFWDILTVEGVGTAKGFEQMIDEFNEKTRFKLKKSQGSMPNSDHASFYEHKIPIIFFFSGFHNQYHTPADTADLINVNGMKRIADLAEMVTAKLASDPTRPEYVQVKGGGAVRIGDSPKLGIRPDYDSEKGLVVIDIVPGGVAEAAGIKTGDVIVEMAGKQVKSLPDYQKIMAAHKIGQTMEIVVMRDNNKVTLKATLK